jgi:5-methylcytosine-specific restriction endonuclease McrA
VDRTLVLNATYEPLCVVNWRRAVVLLLAEKADAVELSGEAARSASTEFDIPSVIRLRYCVRVPYRRDRIPMSRRGVLRRDDHRCAYCPRHADTIDHVIPRSKGGTNTWDNVVAACLRCNARKADRTLEELGWKLDFVPGPPRGTEAVVLAVGTVADEWMPYLVPVA